MTDPVPLPAAPVPCPHCEDGHDAPNRTAWNVFVGPERDGDGQPVRLWVEPTAGAHVAWEDALWLWRLIRERDRLAADRPLDLGPDGLPRLRASRQAEAMTPAGMTIEQAIREAYQAAVALRRTTGWKRSRPRRRQ
jgi:hypothetical protein